MLKKKVYDALELTEDSGKPAVFFNILIIILIVASVLSIIIESITEFETLEFFFLIEIVSIIVFTIEYFLRLWTCTENKEFKRPIIGRIKYAFTPLALIDFLAIAPFYLPIFMSVDLRFLRVLRLFRIFRVFKLARYTHSFDILVRVLKREKEALLLTFFLLIVVVIISSSLMYYVERDVQPEAFASIPHALWWAVASLTTVGYGDIYPISPIGKLMAAIIAIVGIGFVALPTGIISSGYVEELRNRKDDTAHDIIGDLERIATLKENGHLTVEEFEQLKDDMLHNNSNRNT
ncbi:ion transporter [Methanogenium sp. S4BF]|uniref:ion transporter n=1 Tax=Methanogenium sp. S4BF TaxID=1789226 RepID=UPI002417FA6D|nr:ion transporter [Methanogenium sp. S4BF]WFN35225.1 ion transporter [Methanogenium sp. S4BF]